MAQIGVGLGAFARRHHTGMMALAGLALVAMCSPAMAQNGQFTPMSAAKVKPGLGAAPVAGVDAANVDAAALLDEARQMLRAGRSADALSHLAPLVASVKAQTKGPQVYCAHDQVEALSYMGRTAEGSDVRLLTGDQCDGLYLRAFALTDMGRKADAVAALEQLTALSPEYPRYYVELGFAYRQQGEPAKALASYEQARMVIAQSGRASQYRRERAAALRGIGSLLIDAKDWARAQQAYADSLVDDPDSRVAHSQLAYIAAQTGEQKGG
jgi:tetratricopeptide (TPR) repeat protein